MYRTRAISSTRGSPGTKAVKNNEKGFKQIIFILLRLDKVEGRYNITQKGLPVVRIPSGEIRMPEFQNQNIRVEGLESLALVTQKTTQATGTKYQDHK